MICWSFTFWHHLRSYQAGYWLVTVDTHGDFIVLPYWKTRLSEPWRLYSATLLEDQAVSTMLWYPTQSYFTDTEPASPCPILIMPSSWLGSDKYQFNKSTDSTTMPSQYQSVLSPTMMYEIRQHLFALPWKSATSSFRRYNSFINNINH